MDEPSADTGPVPPGASDGDAAREASPPTVEQLPSWRKRWKSRMLVALIIAAAATLIYRRVWIPTGVPANLALQQSPDDKKNTKGPTDPFTFGPFTLRPSESDRIESGIKPGHWTMASQDVRANFDDFRGELVTEVVQAGGDGVELDGQAFHMRSSRPAVLPKLQKKLLDIAMFNPVEHFSRQVAPRLLSRTGRDVWNARELLSPIPPAQFFLVVLARQPEDYRYLNTLDVIRAPQGSSEDRGAQAHYRVVLPTVTTFAQVPSHALFWTSTAVLLWDGLDPTLLSTAQQQALIDWLHWGGQLIVSGPDSLDQLRDSFLDGVLPAAGGESWELTEDTLAALGRISPDTEKKLRLFQPWTGQHLNVEQRDALVLAETDEHQPLIAERRIGRGRTVVTAFRLAQRDLIDWAGFDAVFNAALLRAPGRRFARSIEDKVGVEWADGVEEAPGRVTQVRFFTRDAGRPLPQPRDVNELRGQRGLVKNQVITGTDPFGPDADLVGQKIAVGPGIAAWDDQSNASQAARESLKEAAGIQVPRARFVFALLGTYIFVLVPLNWLLCRSIGRVEMAWLLAPAIAVVFGVIVVRLAQLDIGFVRSATELAVLEVQGDYPRAHLTRYCALYTSLSTDYSLALSNPTAVALPFATGIGLGTGPQQRRGTVVLRQEPDTGTAGEIPMRLEQLTVSSNSTGMVHTEEMYDLGGSLQFVAGSDGAKHRVRNGTSLHLRNVVVMDRNTRAADGPSTEHRYAWLGTLEPGGEAEFQLFSRQDSGFQGPSDQDAKAFESLASLNVQPLVDVAQKDIGIAELRLMAWTDDELSGVTITPAANQARHAAAIVAHLSYGAARPLDMDFNSRAQIAEGLPDEAESGDFLAPAQETTTTP
jgi:hypothetical protein